MSKTKLGKAIGISGQFLGLVEDGRSNLTYRSIKKLKDLSGHSSDYILFKKISSLNKMPMRSVIGCI